jgi:eukaryotic-like serine/threonine-protein kinase
VADIFLSYSSADRLWIARFAKVLVERGWSVFWDRQIPVGKQFDQVIEHELDAAKCVIVLWSHSSISSNWVKEEAEEGARRGVLCPVLIEDVRVPMGLRRFQTARLIDWQEGVPHPELDQLMQEVANAVARKSKPSMGAVDKQSLIGKQVQNYQVTSLLGEGGMGAVYLGVHAVLGRQVAIKILRREFAEDPRLVDRFINEAKAANAIRHPGIVDVVDVGTLASGLPYLIMEMLAGETLRARLGRGPMPVATAVDIAYQTADALAAAHAVGVVHRDLKPENLFLVSAGPVGDRVKVLDFGIAKLTGSGFAADSAHTKTGAVLGTPAYMSPEQCRGSGDIDHRTDVYALGIILFEMLTGQQPFRAAGFGDLMMLHMTAPPPAPRSLNPAIPARIEAAVLRALAKRPEDRFERMSDLARVLTDGRGAQPNDPPPPHANVVDPGETRIMTGGTQVLLRDDARTPTTMTGTAAEVRPPPPPAAGSRTRRPLMLAAAAVFVAMAGFILLAGGRRAQPPVQPPPPMVALTTRQAGVQTVKDQAKDAGAGVVPGVVPVLARETYSITVSAQPPGSAIELDGVRVGTGAFTRRLVADGGSHTLRISRKGYAGKTIVFGETTPPPPSIALDRLKAQPQPDPVGPKPEPIGPAYQKLTP